MLFFQYLFTIFMKSTERNRMDEIKNHMDLLKLLDRSNCKKCGLPTCLAFAVAVFKGEKQLGECPALDGEIVERYSGTIEKRNPLEDRVDDALKEMKKRIAETDLAAAAERLGAEFADGKLTLLCLGKRFSVDTNGNIMTEIHVHNWIVGPVYNYILNGAGADPTGDWVKFRDLKGGRERYGLFAQRCEKPCKKIADANPNLFDDLIRVFNGRQVENHYESDVSLVLHPLPKLPILICYWKPDGELESDLNIFFDSTADRNLDTESIHYLASGLVLMFEKLFLKHDK